MRKYRTRMSVCVMVLLLLVTSCMTKELVSEKEGLEVVSTRDEARAIRIIGDVIDPVDILESGIELKKAIEQCQPIYESYNVSLIAEDGFMVKVDGDSIKGMTIAYDESKGWYNISDLHPINSRAKHIKEIVISKKDSAMANRNYGINIMTQEGDIHRSIGEVLSGTYESLAFSDGTSALNGVKIDVMKRKKCVKLSSLISDNLLNGQVKLLLIDKDGLHHYETVEDAYIEVHGQKIHYISLDQMVYIRNIVGIVVNPSPETIMNQFHDAQYYLGQGEKVLTLFIDGFSFDQYDYIHNNEPQMFLGRLSNVVKAMSVYKPVTNAGFAAMISGEVPGVNGVLDRSKRILKVPTIFDYASDLGYSSILIEGNVNILQITTNIELNKDENGNDYTDDEVFDSATKHIYEGHNYAMVHFHGLDDSGHDYGPLSEETLHKLREVDGYVEALANAWDGPVIITADHGMHETNKGGNHGEFRSEDMYVPYAVYTKK